MTRNSYFISLANANEECYVPNAAHFISPWAILEVSIKSIVQLDEVVELLSGLLSQYSISWQPTIKNQNTFWVAFESEDELMAFRLSI